MEKSIKYKSHCPQYLGLDVFGDKWTLLIIRDMIIDGKRHFREFLSSEEKIASNILTNRLQALELEGIIRKESDPMHKQKIIYSLTEKGIDLFPILMEIAKWSIKYKEVDIEKAARANKIIKGGKETQQAIMKELKREHSPN
ncbi:winged helix-turn-helix transcriptional regulator [Xanthovirga aplysinae]|uniref:winged helix-turn-helix transcriptional regulator n=1 Tax=Xanthovirga aplysinae TaxID=2529853 RepID=UPI0012BD49BC|nr:helix-turn-helix domain-containing protein [Xanthovirga aplysinae]MTI31344.1 transcriptional regulator [Xanthovirga aplysinae]